MLKKQFPVLLILLVALLFRTYRLTDLPPGLTHDEANHGREAAGILDGEFLFYFPLNYGSEPFYSYAVAGSMFLLGENLFALRIVNVAASLGAMILTYLWALRVFDRRTALLTLGLMAISFWPLASSRQALRAGMLPLFMTGAVWLYWQLSAAGREEKPPLLTKPKPVLLTILFASALAATFHIYLAARVAWLLFPAFTLYLAARHRARFRRAWLSTLLGLLLAGLLVIPMFSYLNVHPEAQTRLGMLSGPLEQLKAGEISPLLKNSGGALLAFVWPGYGDAFLAYNIPGRPVLDALSAFFFVLGILVSIKRWKQPPYVFLLLWFIIGVSPSLVTGPTANTTRNMAALPTVYLLAAIGFLATARPVGLRVASLMGQGDRFRVRGGTAALACLWVLIAGWMSGRDYFATWGESADVRGAYQHTLVEMLAFLRSDPGTGPLLISSVYPGPAHDPSIAVVTLPDPGFQVRWMDARSALLLPDSAELRALIPTSTPLHPAFQELLERTSSVALRSDDLDPGFSSYEVNTGPLDQWIVGDSVDFGGALSLLQTRWVAPTFHPGSTAELLTIWRVMDPGRVGPLVPPAFTTDVVLFTHVLDGNGEILAQRDALDAPSWGWQPGDIVLQIHSITVPEGTDPGSYKTVVGLYDRLSGDRLPLLSAGGEIVDTRAVAMPLTVTIP